MALIKIIDIGEELLFDLRQKGELARDISVILVERAGRRAVVKIRCDRSIPIHHVKLQQMESGQGTMPHGAALAITPK